MNNYKIFFLVAVLLVAGAFFLLPSDEKKIKDNLASLAEYCSSVVDEPVLQTLQKAALAAKLCNDPCKVKIESFKLDREFSQKEITDHILMMKKRLSHTSFSFKDTVIDILGDGRAEIMTTLRLDGEIQDSKFTDAYEINISAEKIGGDWLFSSFMVVEFMKK